MTDAEKTETTEEYIPEDNSSSESLASRVESHKLIEYFIDRNVNPPEYFIKTTLVNNTGIGLSKYEKIDEKNIPKGAYVEIAQIYLTTLDSKLVELDQVDALGQNINVSDDMLSSVD